MTEWVLAEMQVEIIINELPIIGRIIAHKKRSESLLSTTDAIHLSNASNVSFVAPVPWNVCFEG